MRYLITEEQHNDLLNMLKLMSNNDDDLPLWVKRRITLMDENLEDYISDTDPTDYDDEFDYASAVINRIIDQFFSFDFDGENLFALDDDKYTELMDILKERYGFRLFEEYSLSAGDDDEN